MTGIRILVLCVTLASAVTAQAEPVDFQREIRPLFSFHCFECHGPDEKVRKAGLRFDMREGALRPSKTGEAAIVPGDPEASELVRRIMSADPGEVMPPPAAKRPLTTPQKELLKRWIAEGAAYQPHWSFIRPVQRPYPPVEQKEWPSTAMDFFVLARMEQAGLSPSPPADRYALVRRAYLDLIGLPPTPEQADRFVRDASPNAYEQLIDHLLASPHFGERWARRWLDLARYADTNGYEKDRPRSIWAYRDWVINALNEDMAFDRFTVEQIAGDMLPQATKDQVIATGFHRNTMINEEGGIDPLEYRFHAMVDRVHVTATTWLGLTMACAQCHSHKYDPIAQEEYYRFMALLDNADEPRIEIPKPDVFARREAIEQEIQRMQADLIGQFPPNLEIEWFEPEMPAAFHSEQGAEAELIEGGIFLVKGKRSAKDTYTLRFNTSQSDIAYLMLEALTDESLPKSGPGRADNGNFVLSEIAASVTFPGSVDSPIQVEFADVQVDYAQPKFPAKHAIDGKTDTGWAIGGVDPLNVRRTATFFLKQSIKQAIPGGGAVAWTIKLVQHHGDGHTLGKFRLRFGKEIPDERPLEVRRREHLEEKFGQWLDTERSKAVAWTLLEPTEASSNVPYLAVEKDHSVFASGDFTKSDTYRIELKNDLEGLRAIRLEVLADDRLPNGGPGTVYYEGPAGDFWLSSFHLFVDGHEVEIQSATESFSNGANKAEKALDDDLQSGWSIKGGQGRDHSAVFRLTHAITGVDHVTVEMLFERYYAAGLGRFRIWGTSQRDAQAAAYPNSIQALLLKDRHSKDELNTLKRYFSTMAPELEEQRQAIERLEKSMPKFPTTLVMKERSAENPRTTYVRHRGDFLQPRQAVEPGVPAALPRIAADAPRNRLGLARWLVSRDNPLTARVVVNRHWEALFGRGLVATTEDFGTQGERPSHPDLLDWLAVDFMERGWSMKALLKTIVMSATYRQASRVTPSHLEIDPENRLLARGPRLRLEAEMIRDSALVASGLLTDKIGGPSVFPPQPPSVTTEGAYGQLKWKSSDGADRYRRSLYTYAKRTAPFAMLMTFDAPSGEACVPRRERSNTPLQSLTLLNDAMFMEMAQALGKSIAECDGSTEERMTHLFRRCLTRYPTREELEKLTTFYRKQQDRFASQSLSSEEILGEKAEQAPADAGTWVTLARVVMNLDEAITKP